MGKDFQIWNFLDCATIECWVSPIWEYREIHIVLPGNAGSQKGTRGGLHRFLMARTGGKLACGARENAKAEVWRWERRAWECSENSREPCDWQDWRGIQTGEGERGRLWDNHSMLMTTCVKWRETANKGNKAISSDVWKVTTQPWGS